MRRFELKEDHLKLLRAAYVEWDDAETGAPAINPKRPYGNSGVTADVAKILGTEAERCPHCDEPLADNHETLDALHRETEFAMALVLSRAGEEVEPGTYVRHGHNDWERVDD